MTMKKALLSMAALTALAAVSAQATPIRLDGPETDLQQIVNNMTVGGASSVDVVNDQYALDQGWEVNSIFGGAGTIVMELAGYAGFNRLGIYDVYDPGNRLQLFNGAAGATSTVRFDIDSAGRVSRNFVDTGSTFNSNLFGFYLETPVGLWFSQSSLNADGGDHLIAYQGQGDSIHSPFGGTRSWGSDMFLLGWEDLSAANWDQDYNDFVLFVGGVQGVNVPEPASMGLLGLGLFGIGLLGRRRRKR